VAVAGRNLSLPAVRAELLTTTPGESVAYLTDFGLPDDAELARVAEAVRGCGVLVCEAQYRGADAELARENHHLTSPLAARLAAEAGAGRLVLMHVSTRYGPAEWRGLLEEARAIFPAAEFPGHWGLDSRPD
jgi:ribonuclease Z